MARKKREPLSFRPTDAVAAKLREVTHDGAKESISSYVSKVLADHFGLPDFQVDIEPAAQEQAQLPLRNVV